MSKKLVLTNRLGIEKPRGKPKELRGPPVEKHGSIMYSETRL